MEIDIKEYLNNDVELTRFLGDKDRIFPLFTTDISKPSIVYNFTPIGGGYIEESQLELKIIWNDYDEILNIRNRLKNILDIKEDKPSIAYANTYFRSKLSGGGLLFLDEIQMYECTMYFLVKMKER